MHDDACAHGKHLAPATGGCCPCGMVTRVPAARPDPADRCVRDLVARCLVERGGAADLPELRRRADRVLAALARAGLELTPRAGRDAPAERRPA
ncbi:hypothetical protein [Blastococcus sp. SYSU D01042]